MSCESDFDRAPGSIDAKLADGGSKHLERPERDFAFHTQQRIFGLMPWDDPQERITVETYVRRVQKSLREAIERETPEIAEAGSSAS
jgi:hypothetical protein